MDAKTRCQCPQCCKTPAKTWTPAWRLECEARFVMRMAAWQQRDYLAQPLVQGRAADLRKAMDKLQAKRRAAA